MGLSTLCQRACELYNIVLAHPDKGSVESWTAEGSAELMKAVYTDFEPRCVFFASSLYLSHVTQSAEADRTDREHTRVATARPPATEDVDAPVWQADSPG